jgi:hypothetical protein
MHEEGFSFLTSGDVGPVDALFQASSRVAQAAMGAARSSVSNSFTRLVNNPSGNEAEKYFRPFNSATPPFNSRGTTSLMNLLEC